MEVRYGECGCGKKLKTLSASSGAPICASCNEKQAWEILELIKKESEKVPKSRVPLSPKGRLVFPKQTALACTYWSNCWLEDKEE